MSAFRDAWRAMVIDALRCPRCKAMNRPGAHLIKMDETGTRAFCDQCTAEGLIEIFQEKQP